MQTLYKERRGLSFPRERFGKYYPLQQWLGY
jgi:hypothetical protein